MTYPYRIVMVTMDGEDGNGYVVVWVLVVDHWKPAHRIITPMDMYRSRQRIQAEAYRHTNGQQPIDTQTANRYAYGHTLCI